MARTWIGVRVELLGGRGQECWPPPGRMMAVGPRHTFADLAAAIDSAFARWDRAHLCRFTLSDGGTVTDEESAEELDGVDDAVAAPLLLDRQKVLGTVRPGEQFRYVFDFGDEWTHCCTVEENIDPDEVLGIVPKDPLPYWGGGSIPDQYGRRSIDDDGESPLPPRPARPHPMLYGEWPDVTPADPVDAAQLRGATHRADVDAILAAIAGHDIGDCLQQVGAGLQVVLAAAPERAAGLGPKVVERLRARAGDGDDVLAEDLRAAMDGTPLATRTVAVDLTEVSYQLEGDFSEAGGYLDLQTGEVVPDILTDPAEVGEDAAVDLEDDPDRWLFLERLGSRSGWRDMAAFAADQRDEGLRDRLESAIEGRGAFRRFRDVISQEGLIDPWRRFSEDRQMGRAREYLAERGVRARA